MGRGAEGPALAAGGERPRRRWTTALVVFLLITIPAGYLVISAIQSRASGENKAEGASATGLTEGWPTRVQRRIYDVWIPPASADVAFYETNSWDTSAMYVQFITSAEGLDRFLATLRTDRSALHQGKVTIDTEHAGKVGWRLGPGEDWAGLRVDQKDPEPTLDVTVDLGNPRHPEVYLVSTVTP
ncbi:hypothetical protein [Streptomyces palmae]|uniref:Sugar kinase n=1 Tax=Streptomyces palmae TaxID=1701085 RepID=A0A4Z0HAI0_9ACTN|nr:hypothetical protein [Streptomyces palmae]TGB11401.1 hypothetical protein E4099_12035 [Streptomyces palmae]